MSFGVKIGSISIGLLLVPMTINYINPIQYGIWLTISSIVSWMSFFDIGLGNGLRNKLTSSLALNNYEDSQVYVSTTYAVLAIISTILFIGFLLVNPYINWVTFLNIPPTISENISQVILVVVGTFCIQFIVQTLNVILTSTHQPAIAALISFLGQLGVLIGVFILKQIVPGSLAVLVWVLTLIPIITLVLASLFFFNTKLKFIAPNVGKINFSYAGNILNVGGAFFIIQIGALVLFQTNNIILTKVLGPAAVTEFNVAYKLFSVLIMGFTIVITPYWSAFTDAITKNDYEWMSKSVTKLRKGWLILALILVPVFTLLSKFIFSIWIGNSVQISGQLTIMMALYVIGYTCLSLNCFFLNGVGKVRIQLILYIFSSFINIPLAIFFAKSYGVMGVVLSNVIIFFVMNIILWIQCNQVLNKSKSKIWN